MFTFENWLGATMTLNYVIATLLSLQFVNTLDVAVEAACCCSAIICGPHNISLCISWNHTTNDAIFTQLVIDGEKNRWEGIQFTKK